MRILRTLTVTAAATIALASSTLTGTALADPPPPGGCATGIGVDNTRYAYCSAGYGFVRVKISCANDFNKRTTVYGQWKSVPNVPPAGAVSYAKCTSSYPYVMSVGYETRAL